MYFVSRRIQLPANLREAIRVKQECKCALCKDNLGHKFEIDHISPLCQGGSNEVDNLRAICCQCHQEETDRLNLAGLDLNDKARFHTI